MSRTVILSIGFTCKSFSVLYMIACLVNFAILPPLYLTVYGCLRLFDSELLNLTLMFLDYLIVVDTNE